MFKVALGSAYKAQADGVSQGFSMMREYLIAGNWKMHGNTLSIAALLEALLSKMKRTPTAPQTVVFPSFPYLSLVAERLRGSPLAWGAQNLCQADPEGAFTGEVSAAMLKEFGCRYVLVGHSERRTVYLERDALIAQKLKTALAASLKPILCIGETLAEREEGLTWSVLKKQLATLEGLQDNHSALESLIIAYEPVWAIGTGRSATPEQAQEVHAQIRDTVRFYAPHLADRLQILYGGSVKAENAVELLAMPDIDGALVGGASLKAEQFIEIINACNS